MNKLKILFSAICLGVLLNACGGGGSDTGGGEEAVMTPTTAESSGTADFSGNWQGKSVVRCPTSECILDVDCSIEQTGAKIDGVCSTVLVQSCLKFLSNSTDKFTYPVSGNSTSFDLYSDANAEGVTVTLDGKGSLTVSSVPFAPCTQPAFKLNKT